MDKLAAMQAFVAIVDHGSLSEAANRLGKSPPAMTRSLKALEESMQTQLLQRTSRRPRLTPEGRAFYDSCRKVLHEVGLAEAEVAALSSSAAGEVRLTAPVTFGRRHVAPVIIALQERFPGLVFRVELDYAPLPPDAGSFDLAVRIGELEDSSLMARKLGTMPSRLLAAPSLLKRLGTPANPASLEGAPSICLDVAGRRPGHLWRLANEDGTTTHITSNPVLYCNDFDFAMSSCIAGAGFLGAYLYQCEDEIAAGTLVPVLPEHVPPPHPVHLLRRPGSRMPVRIEAAVTALEGELRKRLRRFAAV